MNWLTKARVAAKKTKTDLANVLEISRPTYNRLEDVPDRLTLGQLSVLNGIGIRRELTDKTITKVQVDALKWLAGRCADQFVTAWIVQQRDLLQQVGSTPRYRTRRLRGE
jgi:hypothetical protein